MNSATCLKCRVEYQWKGEPKATNARCPECERPIRTSGRSTRLSYANPGGLGRVVEQTPAVEIEAKPAPKKRRIRAIIGGEGPAAA